jgi:hypothetical protein
LAERIEPRIRAIAPNDGTFLQATIPDRLDGSVQHQQAIGDAISEALRLGANVSSTACDVSLRRFSLANSPFMSGLPSEQTVIEFLDKRLGVQDAAHLLILGAAGQVVILRFLSSKPDQMLKYIFKRAKEDARSQFTGKLPAILCWYFSDLTEGQLIELKKDEDNDIVTGIRRAVSALINSRPHLHSVALMADGRVNVVRQRTSTTKSTMVQSYGTTYYFPNTDHPEASNQALKGVFG